MSERPPADEEGPQAESERKDVNGGEQRADDHGAVYLALARTDKKCAPIRRPIGLSRCDHNVRPPSK